MFNLNILTRSFQRYLNIMGWEKVRTKYCQAESLKNPSKNTIMRILRVIFILHYYYIS
jgi:hypothetical protein